VSWLYFLQGSAPQLDLGWITQCVNASKYVEPPPLVAPRDGGRVDGVTQRDRQVEALYRENYDLKLCVASLLHLLVAKGMVTRQEIIGLVEEIARGQHPFGYLTDHAAGDAVPDGDNPFANLK
jgi:hypothetical protein